ncbi:MAG: hypothetical protein AABY10_01985 [Nanoarchaeota archaeon]
MSEERYKLKIAVVAGASHAMKFKEKNPRAQTQEVIKHVTESVEEILNNLDSNESY